MNVWVNKVNEVNERLKKEIFDAKQDTIILKEIMQMQLSKD